MRIKFMESEVFDMEVDTIKLQYDVDDDPRYLCSSSIDDAEMVVVQTDTIFNEIHEVFINAGKLMDKLYEEAPKYEPKYKLHIIVGDKGVFIINRENGTLLTQDEHGFTYIGDWVIIAMTYTERSYTVNKVMVFNPKYNSDEMKCIIRPDYFDVNLTIYAIQDGHEMAVLEYPQV